MEQRYSELRDMAEQELGRMFDSDLPQKRLIEAMRYSLLAGGKRLRPVLVLEFCRISGGDLAKALPIAAAVEMLHTYTLIHDDLPCMDDDDLRRGKPANHKVYGEAAAILAGDALQAAAFRCVLGADITDCAARSAAIVLAEVAGETGVCGGQILDLDGEGKRLSEQEIMDIYSMKTSALFCASAKMGAIAGGANERQVQAASVFGENLGLAFQLRDDILDETGSEVDLGKNVGSDCANDKSTLLSIYGLERCEGLVREKTDAALKAARGAFDDTEFISWLALMLTDRSR